MLESLLHFIGQLHERFLSMGSHRSSPNHGLRELNDLTIAISG